MTTVAMYYAAYWAFKNISARAIKVGSDWTVDYASAAAIEEIYALEYTSSGKKIDHRRRPWCTMRRFVKAYKTGDKTKFEELRESIRELKDDLTGDAQEELAEAMGQGGVEAVENMMAGVNAMADMMANTPA